jgi:cobalamin-dependent methionine synthase I
MRPGASVPTVGERTNANGSKAFREEQSTDAFVLHHPDAKYFNV